jgi:anti-sigma regulatory factor (Ser/Thr protein kinase)
VTMPATEPPFSQSPASIRIRGGVGAPGRARLYVMAQLDGQIPDNAACDAALIVSELVTNSVLHANVGVHDALSLELTPLDDLLHISVTDPGSQLEPRLPADDFNGPGGFGLRLVDQMSAAWGVEREAAGATRVWCDLPLPGAGSS